MVIMAKNYAKMTKIYFFHMLPILQVSYILIQVPYALPKMQLSLESSSILLFVLLHKLEKLYHFYTVLIQFDYIDQV